MLAEPEAQAQASPQGALLPPSLCTAVTGQNPCLQKLWVLITETSVVQQLFILALVQKERVYLCAGCKSL